MQRWLPSKRMFAIAVLLGLAWGTLDAVRDERRKRRDSEVWDEANIPRPMDGDGSGPEGTDPGDRASSGSDVQMP